MSIACTHVHTPGRADNLVANALSRAETACLAAGERWTAPRRRVFERLLRASGPTKAYDLMEGFGDDGQSAKPPTVYRALEFLERLGLVHRIESLNAFIACDGGPDPHEAAFLICSCCGAAEEFEPAVGRGLQATARSHGFSVKDVTLEVRGVCQRCAA